MALAMATDVAEAELLLLPRCHENHARHDTPAAHAHPVANRLATTTSVGYSSPTPPVPGVAACRATPAVDRGWTFFIFMLKKTKFQKYMSNREIFKNRCLSTGWLSPTGWATGSKCKKNYI